MKFIYLFGSIFFMMQIFIENSFKKYSTFISKKFFSFLILIKQFVINKQIILTCILNRKKSTLIS